MLATITPAVVGPPATPSVPGTTVTVLLLLVVAYPAAVAVAIAVSVAAAVVPPEVNQFAG